VIYRKLLIQLDSGLQPAHLGDLDRLGVLPPSTARAATNTKSPQGPQISTVGPVTGRVQGRVGLWPSWRRQRQSPHCCRRFRWDSRRCSPVVCPYGAAVIGSRDGAEGSRGADTKHKVFWVTGCNPGYPGSPPSAQ
jgi:hypothetical protein